MRSTCAKSPWLLCWLVTRSTSRGGDETPTKDARGGGTSGPTERSTLHASRANGSPGHSAQRVRTRRAP